VRGAYLLSEVPFDRNVACPRDFFPTWLNRRGRQDRANRTHIAGRQDGRQDTHRAVGSSGGRQADRTRIARPTLRQTAADRTRIARPTLQADRTCIRQADRTRIARPTLQGRQDKADRTRIEADRTRIARPTLQADRTCIRQTGHASRQNRQGRSDKAERTRIARPTLSADRTRQTGHASADRTRIARPTRLRVTERRTRLAKPFRRQSAAQSMATLIFGDEHGKRSRRTYWYDVQCR
jgi:hypothetical protein